MTPRLVRGRCETLFNRPTTASGPEVGLVRHLAAQKRFRAGRLMRCPSQVVAFGKAGLGRVEIAALLRISQATLSLWSASTPALRDSLERARDEELAWWETQARQGLGQGARLNATLWSKCASARFAPEPVRAREAHTPEPDDSDASLRARAKAVAVLLAQAGDL